MSVLNPETKPRRQPWRAVVSLIAPYWASEEKWAAWALLTAVVALALAMVYMTVLFNSWYNAFYDALQAKDAGVAWMAHVGGFLTGFLLVRRFAATPFRATG